MTTGAVIISHNNSAIDYIGMAAWSAANIQRHLNIPVALITDNIKTVEQKYQTCFDHIIQLDKLVPEKRYFNDIGETVNWYNTSRPDVFDVTPWDRTLLLDADYVVASSSLTNILQYLKLDFWCYHSAYDITFNGRLQSSTTFGEHNYPMLWATAMVFNKTSQVKFIFDTMNMIRNNWNHYRDIYKINKPTYRNDIALSIAYNLVYQKLPNKSDFFTSLATVLPEDRLFCDKQDHYKIEYLSNNKLKLLGLSGLDFHAMCKKSLENIIAKQC